VCVFVGMERGGLGAWATFEKGGPGWAVVLSLEEVGGVWVCECVGVCALVGLCVGVRVGVCVGVSVGVCMSVCDVVGV
jgi:hypothetical protein